MTGTGWIFVLLVAVLLIVGVVVALRRKPPEALGEASPVEDLLPEQMAFPAAEPEAVTPEPLAATLPPVEVSVPAEGATPAIDLSGALAENDEPPVGELLPAEERVAASTPAVPAAVQAAADSEGDNLLRLKGVGPKIVNLLKAEGITRYAQIAAWGPADLAAIDAKLGSFAGRPTRDNWVDQAALLAADDVAGYEAKYGKL